MGTLEFWLYHVRLERDGDRVMGYVNCASQERAERLRAALGYGAVYRGALRVGPLDIWRVLSEYNAPPEVVDAARELAEVWKRTSKRGVPLSKGDVNEREKALAVFAEVVREEVAVRAE